MGPSSTKPGPSRAPRTCRPGEALVAAPPHPLLPAGTPPRSPYFSPHSPPSAKIYGESRAGVALGGSRGNQAWGGQPADESWTRLGCELGGGGWGGRGAGRERRGPAQRRDKRCRRAPSCSRTATPALQPLKETAR